MIPLLLMLVTKVLQLKRQVSLLNLLLHQILVLLVVIMSVVTVKSQVTGNKGVKSVLTIEARRSSSK